MTKKTNVRDKERLQNIMELYTYSVSDRFRTGNALPVPEQAKQRDGKEGKGKEQKIRYANDEKQSEKWGKEYHQRSWLEAQNEKQCDRHTCFASHPGPS